MKTMLFILVILFAYATQTQAANPDYHPGKVLTLVALDGTAPSEAGTAKLFQEGDNVVVEADFIDSHIGNKAVVNNERTWLTGDVCEFFFMPAGRTDYYEFHVTPNEKTLQLHIRGIKYLKKVPFESQIIEAHLKFKVKVSDGRWSIRMEIPLKSLGDKVKLDGSLFAVCRYNYGPGSDKPLLSSTPQLPDSFHCPPRWYRIVKP